MTIGQFQKLWHVLEYQKEKRAKNWRNGWGNNGWELSKINDRWQATYLVSSEDTKQNKYYKQKQNTSI